MIRRNIKSDKLIKSGVSTVYTRTNIIIISKSTLIKKYFCIPLSFDLYIVRNYKLLKPI